MKQKEFFLEKTKEKLKIYQNLLQKWQQSINLISPSTLSDIMTRHFQDSAQLYPLIPDTAQTLVDMGSGAGFPGLVLAIMDQTQGNGKLDVHLVESDQRKCVFLREVIRQSQIKATVHSSRLENIPPFQADVVTARALKDLKKLLDLAQPFLTSETVCLFLKGEKAQKELSEASQYYSFNVEKISSQTADSGLILKLTEIKK